MLINNVLITGGCGFLGVSLVNKLLELGSKNIRLIDNLSVGNIKDLEQVCNFTEIKSIDIEGSPNGVELIVGDIRDKRKLSEVFTDLNVGAVIHFAGLKSVSESILQPMSYYKNNVYGSLQLLSSMAEHNINAVVFSSSATVYGETEVLPLRESLPLGVPKNPYGMSKCMVENILSDLYISDDSWSIGILRYFNPVGAHPSGLIGEDPAGKPNNLMPLITQTALGKRNYLQVFGGDYPTRDGSGVRDYIHVVDLAKGHLAALEKVLNGSGTYTANLGTGMGCSVLELIKTFERVNDVNVPYEIVGRRKGDVAECYADSTFATSYLGWKAEYTIDQMCRDSWNWQSKNPAGYDS